MLWVRPGTLPVSVVEKLPSVTGKAFSDGCDLVESAAFEAVGS